MPRGPLAETPTERGAGQEVIWRPLGGACVIRVGKGNVIRLLVAGRERQRDALDEALGDGGQRASGDVILIWGKAGVPLVLVDREGESGLLAGVPSRSEAEVRPNVCALHAVAGFEIGFLRGSITDPDIVNGTQAHRLGVGGILIGHVASTGPGIHRKFRCQLVGHHHHGIIGLPSLIYSALE